MSDNCSCFPTLSVIQVRIWKLTFMINVSLIIKRCQCYMGIFKYWISQNHLDKDTHMPIPFCSSLASLRLVGVFLLHFRGRLQLQHTLLQRFFLQCHKNPERLCQSVLQKLGLLDQDFDLQLHRANNHRRIWYTIPWKTNTATLVAAKFFLSLTHLPFLFQYVPECLEDKYSISDGLPAQHQLVLKMAEAFNRVIEHRSRSRRYPHHHHHHPLRLSTKFSVQMRLQVHLSPLLDCGSTVF